MANLTTLMQGELDALISRGPTDTDSRDDARAQWTRTSTGLQHLLTLIRNQPAIMRDETLISVNPDDYVETYSMNIWIDGRLWFISSPSDISGSGLKCFALYVPRTYRLSPDGGHRVWLHFPPTWGVGIARAKRHRMLRDFSAWTSYCPQNTLRSCVLTGNPGFWVFDYLQNYFFAQNLLLAASAINMNAIFLLPLYDFTTGESLQRLAAVSSLLQNLQSVLAQLEVLSPDLVRRTSSRPGSVGRIGVSCYSFGARFLMDLLGSDRSNRVQAAVFLDGILVPDSGDTTRAVYNRRFRNVITKHRSPLGSRLGGWFGQAMDSSLQKRLVMSQQPDNLLWMYASLLDQPFPAGSVVRLVESPTTLGKIHAVRPGFAHDDVLQKFSRNAFEFCAPVFTP